MARIAVDIDSTLYDFEQPSRDACFKLWKETGDEKYKQAAYHPWTEWRSPADVLGVERWLKAIAVVHDDDAILGMEPFTGAVETCQALIDAGHELIYISNRATETEYANQSRCHSGRQSSLYQGLSVSY
jgi:FMN phosphatase YigB (HAD superfamily)